MSLIKEYIRSRKTTYLKSISYSDPFYNHKSNQIKSNQMLSEQFPPIRLIHPKYSIFIQIYSKLMISNCLAVVEKKYLLFYLIKLIFFIIINPILADGIFVRKYSIIIIYIFILFFIIDPKFYYNVWEVNY